MEYFNVLGTVKTSKPCRIQICMHRLDRKSNTGDIYRGFAMSRKMSFWADFYADFFQKSGSLRVFIFFENLQKKKSQKSQTSGNSGIFRKLASMGLDDKIHCVSELQVFDSLNK